MNDLITVGNIETVAIPDQKIKDVLAKIDTGADSSAIWASNISKKDGVLSYTLFGPSSPHYNGQQINTKKFTRVTVKNSFGVKEKRYRVSIKIRIGDKTIVTRMTLADRNSNRFPIIIGKHTLRGKFVVNVAKKNMTFGRKRILLVTGEENSFGEAYVDSLLSEGLKISRVNYEELIFTFGAKNNSIVIESTQEDVSSYDLVYFVNNVSETNINVAAPVAAYLAKRNIDFIDRRVSLSANPDKIMQYMLLGDNSVKVPPSVFMLPNGLNDAYERLVTKLGLPFILKDIKHYGTESPFLVNSRNDFERHVRYAKEIGLWLLAQQYIPHDFDYRLLVFGGQIFFAAKRVSGNDSEPLHKLGDMDHVESIDIADLPAKLINLAVLSARISRLQVADVNLLQDKVSKVWYCLGVNGLLILKDDEFIREKEAAVAKYLSQRLFD